jgi:hypothetical protein
MNDRQFWDSYMSSMEDLKEDPPPEVKEQLFRRMRREQRRKRWMKRGAFGLLGLLLLGSGGLLMDPWNETDNASRIAQDGVHVWDFSISGLEPELIPEDAARGRSVRTGNIASAPSEGGNGRSKGDNSKDGNVKNGSSRGGEEKDESSAPKRRKPYSEKEAAMASDRSRGEVRDRKEESALSSDRGIEKEAESKGGLGSAEGSPRKDPEQGKGPLESLPNETPVADEPQTPNEIEFGGEFGESDRKIASPRFFVGSDVAFNFTRLLDQKMRESFEPGSLVATEGELYFDFGLTAGLQLSERTSVVGRYFMKKDVGQRYYEYVDGRYMERGIQLSYRNYELLLEHDIVQKDLGDGFSSSISAYGGAHLAQLREAQRLAEGGSLDVSDQYKDRVYGVQGGLRFGMATKRGLDLGLMLGASYGLSDGLTEGASSALTEGSVRNLSVGSALSLRYHFGSRSVLED